MILAVLLLDPSQYKLLGELSSLMLSTHALNGILQMFDIRVYATDSYAPSV